LTTNDHASCCYAHISESYLNVFNCQILCFGFVEVIAKISMKLVKENKEEYKREYKRV